MKSTFSSKMSPTTSYPAIRKILSSLFSVQTGLDDDAAKNAYRRAFAADPVLRTEVVRLFQDGNVNWRELLCNSNYEVGDFDSDEEARRCIHELLVEELSD